MLTPSCFWQTSSIRLLSDTEKQYSTFDREILAILAAVKIRKRLCTYYRKIEHKDRFNVMHVITIHYATIRRMVVPDVTVQ